MDYIFVFIVSVSTLRGFFKGFWLIIFKLITLATSIIFASKFYFSVSVWLSSKDYLTGPIFNFLSKPLRLLLPGSFSSTEQIAQKIKQDCLPIFKNVFERLLRNISFEGELSSPQIFGQSLTNLILKTISFVVIFLTILIGFKIIKKIIKKCKKNKKINLENKFFGSILGFFEGIIIFSLINIVLLNLGEFLLNQSILHFAQSGSFSKIFLDFFNKKIINFF